MIQILKIVDVLQQWKDLLFAEIPFLLSRVLGPRSLVSLAIKMMMRRIFLLMMVKRRRMVVLMRIMMTEDSIVLVLLS